ncbi:MAG: radical SAM protein, partial [Bacteroidales bacterium]|nr:radical SAM protein [Bacteroidales bacterium]
MTSLINMTKISKYSRIYTDIEEDNVILYNTVNRSIISIPEKSLNNQVINDNLSRSELDILHEFGFLDEDIDLKQIECDYEKFTNLIISVETLLACNLACPYCYQIGNNENTKKINITNLELLYDYIAKVYKLSKYHSLTLKILGGEPTINWNIAKHIINKISLFCKSNDVFFKLMIDTNGTKIDDIKSLSNYDSLIITIPLSHKECHNKYRKYASGCGTYDVIIDNINKLSGVLKDVSIVLRHNTDAININRFREYVIDLKSKLSFRPIISPNYTLNLGDSGFFNNLSHSDFVNWLSADFIDIMAEYNYDIVVSPFNFIGKCQYWSRYSLKLFSDGTVGACAMNFFDKERPSIAEVIENLANIDKYWGNAKNYSIFSDSNCKKCTSLFLCGG